MKNRIETLERMQDILRDISTLEKQIDYLTDCLEGDSAQLWDSLVPKWEAERDDKKREVARLTREYVTLKKEL